MSLPTHSNDVDNTSAHQPQKGLHLPQRNAFTWNLKKPEQGPAMLAIKNHFIAMIGEYVGTVLFMIFALGGTK
ncbi:hypothetical protein HWV62_24976 [Athelia sp. TMB]|nr:hypothetical protein HWV62_24976 [Athelia sp. TMB]